MLFKYFSFHELQVYVWRRNKSCNFKLFSLTKTQTKRSQTPHRMSFVLIIHCPIFAQEVYENYFTMLLQLFNNKYLDAD